jgi:hypothetical protein
VARRDRWDRWGCPVAEARRVRTASMVLLALPVFQAARVHQALRVVGAAKGHPARRGLPVRVFRAASRARPVIRTVPRGDLDWLSKGSTYPSIRDL